MMPVCQLSPNATFVSAHQNWQHCPGIVFLELPSQLLWKRAGKGAAAASKIHWRGGILLQTLLLQNSLPLPAASLPSRGLLRSLTLVRRERRDLVQEPSLGVYTLRGVV